LGTMQAKIPLIAAGVAVVVVGFGGSFAAGWYAHIYYMRAQLAEVLEEGPFASQSLPDGDGDPTEDIADPNQEYVPSERDCPSAKILGETSPTTGPSRTKYFPTKTGQLLAHWEYPDAPTGIIQELKVNPESANDDMPMAGLTTGDFNLPKNQGTSKIESKPGKYRFAFDPEENQLEYVATVYECDPSGGEARSQA
jgi:hypothetical protein